MELLTELENFESGINVGDEGNLGAGGELEGSRIFENEMVQLCFNGNCPALENPSRGSSRGTMTHGPVSSSWAAHAFHPSI